MEREGVLGSREMIWEKREQVSLSVGLPCCFISEEDHSHSTSILLMLPQSTQHVPVLCFV